MDRTLLSPDGVHPPALAFAILARDARDPKLSGCELEFPRKGAAQIRQNWQTVANVKIGFSFAIRLL